MIDMSIDFDFDFSLHRYTMSVKDQLEQSHMDGSHTTVKSKRSKGQSVVSAFNKEQAWQVQQYGSYEGTTSCGHDFGVLPH